MEELVVDVSRILRSELNVNFDKKGKFWLARSNALVWIVSVDKAPRLKTYGLDLGIMSVKVFDSSPPRSTNMCPVFGWGEILAVHLRLDKQKLRDALNPQANLNPDERKQLLSAYVGSLAIFVKSHLTIEAIRVASAEELQGFAFTKNWSQALDSVA